MIRVITDSSSDLPQELADDLGIEIVPLSIRFGDHEYVDRFELSTQAFWDRLITESALPETAAPSAGSFQQAYEKAGAEGAAGIVVITISSELSGTYQSSVIAAERVGKSLAIKIVDSRSVGMGLGLPVLAAARSAAQGADLQTVAGSAVDAGLNTEVVAALDTLEYLQRGGRIGSAQAFFGSLLNIKPLITLDDGIVAPLGRIRTRSKAIAALEERVAARAPGLEAIAVFHGNAPDIDSIVERIQRHVDHEVIVTLLGAVVGTHTGPGTVGIAYLAS